MSFSSEIKSALCALTIKKSCCRKACLYGMLSAQADPDNASFPFATDNEKISALFSRLFKQSYSVMPSFEAAGNPMGMGYFKMNPLPKEQADLLAQTWSIREILLCESCLSSFCRGLFLAGGTVSDPTKKGYHLELLFKSDAVRQSVFTLFTEQGLCPKLTTRKGSLSIYFKNSESIEDFLTVIGAPHAALDLMNAKIMREIRNNENRRSNCDASNIFRSTGAADIQLRAIRKLVDNGKLSLLPSELQTTARIRLENPECSLLEIAAMHEPPLTKSGVNHRMKKIVGFADEN